MSDEEVKFWNGINIGSKPAIEMQSGASSELSQLITVDNTGNASVLTNYSVRVSVTFQLGMQADFSDLRFRDSDDETALSFWIESYTASTSAVVWVKVPSIPASASKNIHLHYGDIVAVGGSNGSDTFTLFENFSSYPAPILPKALRYSMVRLLSGTYYMFVNNQTTLNTDLYTTTDVTQTWSAYGSNPVLALGASGTWDDARLAWGSVGLESNVYYMYYGGFDGAAWGIGLATSSNLLSWTKNGINPIINDASTDPSLLTDLSGNIVKYNNKYWLVRKKAGAAWISSASTISGTWTDEGAASLEVGSAGAWDDNAIAPDCFLYDGSNYYIFYRGSGDGTVYKIGWASATTPNGVYTKYASNPVLSPAETWEGNEAGAPTIIQIDTTFYMFYSGNSTTSSYVGYATASAIGGPYTKHPTTLVQTLGTPVVASGVLTLNSGDFMQSDDSYQYKALRFRANWKGTNGDSSNLKWIGHITGTAGARVLFSTQRSNSGLYLNTLNTVGLYEQISATVEDAYHTYESRWKSGEVEVDIDDTLVLTSTTQVPTSSIPIAARNFEDATADVLLDWLLVREYSDPEPAASIV